MSRTGRVGLVGLALASALAACGTPGPSGTGDVGRAPGSSGHRGTVVVLAAASLTEAFTAIEKDFEAAHPGIDVAISFGASSTLVQQVNHGAPADVIALAGESAAKPLDRAHVKDEQVFASNVLEVAVPPANPGRVTGLADLGRPGLKVVLCAPTVPCGMAADATFAKAGVVPSVVSREMDVKATLAKVRLGEADAAVVYHSDVVASKGAVTGIEVPASLNTVLRYPILRLDDEAATRAFVDFVRGADAGRILTASGLGSP
jgi:molybdate transport system substrate-binding protein